jgi:hypothetical protein
MDRSYNKSFYEALDIYEPQNHFDFKTSSVFQGILPLLKDSIFLIRIGKFYNVKSA